MTEALNENDKSELERRRMAEAVAKSVEETLKKRYTWLAIVVSFLLGVYVFRDNWTNSGKN